MTPSKIKADVPALSLPPAEAAASLGVGVTFFRENVAPHVRCVRRGKVRLFPVDDLKRWVDENAERTI